MQEVKEEQYHDISAKISSRYDIVWHGRDNTEGNTGEGLATAYDKSVWKLVEEGFFFLSETPDVLSKGWDASHRRICAFALLENVENGEKMNVFNVHLDVSGKIAREKGIELVLSAIEKSEYPSFLCGDFNCGSDETAYKLTAHAMLDCQQSAPDADSGTTFNAWGGISPDAEGPVIDFCFVSKRGVEPLKFEICRDKWGEGNANFYSDHYAVKTVLSICEG